MYKMYKFSKTMMVDLIEKKKKNKKQKYKYS